MELDPVILAMYIILVVYTSENEKVNFEADQL